ncbi:tRNA dihydrouridine synthase [Deferrisoma sp.]
MAGVTDPAFRRRLRRAGCRYLFTEMVSAAALARENRRTLAYLRPSDRGPDLAVQVFGSRPDELAEAARAAADAGFSHLDLNMGCPVRKVVRSGAGAALMRDPSLAAACVRALRRAFPGTLSVKIRSGWDAGTRNAAEISALAEAEGADLVIVHPRTRAQGYAGQADWSVVGEVAARVGVPVVGNGDISSGEEAVRRLREFGCAGVMIGRAALGAPWMFAEAEALYRGEPVPAAPGPEERGRDLLLHLGDLVEEKGERVAVAEMRKFAAWAARGLPGATAFRRRVQEARGREAMEEEIRSFFGVPPGSEKEAA